MNKTYLLIFFIFSVAFIEASHHETSKEEGSVFGQFKDSINSTLSGYFPFNYIYDTFNISKSSNLPSSPAEDYDRKRAELVKKDNSKYFTIDVPELTEEEKEVNTILQDLREEVVQGDHSPLLLPYYEGKEIIENSKLYETFLKIPKGAHLHLHPAAGFPMELIMNLTRKNNAFYSDKYNKLITLPDGEKKEGYERCNDLREKWTEEGTFDEFLHNQILLSAEDMASQESNAIWEKFQPKFSLLSGLFKNQDNFKAGLLEICKRALKDGVYVVEFRKSIGGRNISIEQEVEIYQSVLDEMKMIDQDFEITLIIASGKSSDESIEQQLENYNRIKKNTVFVSGFDLVGEEDKLPSIYHYKDLILEAQKESEK